MKDVTELGNIADIYDGPHATPKKIENGKYFLSISSLDNGSLDLSKSAFISDKDFIKWTKRVQPQKGDLLFSYETRLGEAALMPDNLQACLGRRMGLLRPKKDKVIPQYLLFAYLSPEFQKVIRKNTIKGATVDRIALNELGNFPIYIPDLKTQQSIAAALAALDKKIALNKQINARLEEMAKTLYDYWFVQFDFPDANGKPYKSSGGEMVFDETLKREIPKGWEVKSLGEIASTSSGGTPTSTVQEYYKGGNIPWVNSGELNNNFIVHTDNFITQTGMDNSSAKLVSEKSILLAMYGATAGKTSLISFKTTTNQAICSILPKDMNYRVYIKSYLDNMYLYLVQLSSGSARDNLSQDKIKRLHLVIPESGILEIFSKVTEDFYKKIETNLKQNHHLTRLRNFLLPMLMNGQVSVAD